MSRVFYLVSATEEQGIKDAASRGWERIANARFVTPEKDDIRVVCRVSDLHPLAGVTPMYKGSDYDEGPEVKFLRDRWLGEEGRAGEREKFERFVAEGNGQWVT